MERVADLKTFIHDYKKATLQESKFEDYEDFRSFEKLDKSSKALQMNIKRNVFWKCCSR